MSPYEWLETLAGCACAALEESVLGAPELVEYGNMVTAISSGRCSALYVNGGAIFSADGDRWPNRVDPARSVITSIGKICQIVPTMPATLTYVHCVPTVTQSGLPSNESKNASAEDLWATAWTVWEGFTCCLPAMVRTQGRVTRESLTPLAPQGGLSGFTIGFTVALTNCPDC